MKILKIYQNSHSLVSRLYYPIIIKANSEMDIESESELEFRNEYRLYIHELGTFGNIEGHIIGPIEITKNLSKNIKLIKSLWDGMPRGRTDRQALRYL